MACFKAESELDILSRLKNQSKKSPLKRAYTGSFLAEKWVAHQLRLLDAVNHLFIFVVFFSSFNISRKVRH
jgi:hypothetical protein